MKKGVYLKHASEKGGTKATADPWCLVCGVNLRVDGRQFLSLAQDDAEDMRQTFKQVLGVQFSNHYASDNLCTKCERAIRRIGRYQGISSAKSEAKALKDSLERNLKSHGQKPVKASEADKYEVNHFKGSRLPRLKYQASPELEGFSKGKDSPLIENEAQDLKPEVDWDQGEADQENVNPDKMPFDFFKKKSKKDKKDKKDKEKLQDKNVEDANDVKAQEEETRGVAPPPEVNAEYKPAKGTTLATMATHVQKKPEVVEEKPKEPDEPVDGGTVSPNKEANGPVLQENEKVDDTTKEATITEVKQMEIKDPPTKHENSPLINKDEKESKLQDTGPGMLCCTIL